MLPLQTSQINHHANLNRHLKVIIILGLLTFFLFGCRSEDPIQIGFVGELTGRRSEIGVDSRDGTQLAVDIINENGGINGRPLTLIIKNDEGDPEKAQQIDAQLIEQGVVAIIGHITSGQTAAVLDQINESNVVLISPTASSDQFSGQADNFFRVMPATRIQGHALAKYMYETKGVREIVGVYDLSNRVFVETLWPIIKDEFENLGGKADIIFPFTAKESDLQTVASKIVATDPEGIVFISSDIDTALLSQHIRQQNSQSLLFSSGWARTDELPAKGGGAVENLEILAFYNAESSYPSYLEFSEQFEKRFNRPPRFASAYAYEAVLVLAAALEKADGDFNNLAQELTSLQPVEGVQSILSLDEYGDINRDVYIEVIQNGDYKIIEAISFDN